MKSPIKFLRHVHCTDERLAGVTTAVSAFEFQLKTSFFQPERAMCARAAVCVLGREVAVTFMGVGGGGQQLRAVRQGLDSGAHVWQVRGEI